MSDSEEEPSIFGISADLVPPAPIKPAGISEIDFDGLLRTPLKLHEDLKEGCGGQLWPAGMVLGKYLLRKEKEEFIGKEMYVIFLRSFIHFHLSSNSYPSRTPLQIITRTMNTLTLPSIELGAGGGLVGYLSPLFPSIPIPLLINPSLALALHHTPQPIHIHLTDQLPMLALMTRNTTLNALEPYITPSVYDWGSPTPSGIPAKPDIILAADCVYFEPAFPLLLQTLKDLMGEQTVCWFCFKKRRRADLGFVKSLRKGFVVEEVRDDPERGVWEREGLFL